MTFEAQRVFSVRYRTTAPRPALPTEAIASTPPIAKSTPASLPPPPQPAATSSPQFHRTPPLAAAASLLPRPLPQTDSASLPRNLMLQSRHSCLSRCRHCHKLLLYCRCRRRTRRSPIPSQTLSC